MEFPAHLLDELARVFVRVALDRLLRDAMTAAREHDESKGAQGAADASSTVRAPPCDG
jgi:hypothetical protein